MDDTPVRVLDKSLPGTTRKGRFWPYVGDVDHPDVVFDYTSTRERAGPEKFLEDYRGYLQADAYVAYDSFFTDPQRGLVEVACWAHYLDSGVIRSSPWKVTQVGIQHSPADSGAPDKITSRHHSKQCRSWWWSAWTTRA